jgi:arylsulfatase A-like enzyme
MIRWPQRIKPGSDSPQVMISMDWLPTLLSAAGGAPDPAHLPDGIDLLPILTGMQDNQPRKLFWRYRSNLQRAARDGDYKILKIRDNSFLFDVVKDPLERANLKDRHRDIYNQLATEWDVWNAEMLPEDRRSYVDGFDASQLADHFGATPADDSAVDRGSWPK